MREMTEVLRKLFVYVVLPLGILFAVWMGVFHRNGVFAGGEEDSAPVKAETDAEYLAPVISPTAVSFYNWPGSEHPVQVEKEELLKEWLEWGEYVLEVDAVEDHMVVGDSPALFLTRKFHVARVWKGNYTGEPHIYLDYELEQNDEATRLPSHTDKTVSYPIKKAFLILNRNNVAKRPPVFPDGYCIDYSEAYYYQFFVYGEEVGALIDEFLALPKDKNRQYLPTL